jgi:hypothetical protein
LLKEKMLKSSRTAVQGRKVHRRETVAVKMEDIWFRALAIKKIETHNKVLSSLLPSPTLTLTYFVEATGHFKPR